MAVLDRNEGLRWGEIRTRLPLDTEVSNWNEEETATHIQLQSVPSLIRNDNITESKWRANHYFQRFSNNKIEKEPRSFELFTDNKLPRCSKKLYNPSVFSSLILQPSQLFSLGRTSR